MEKMANIGCAGCKKQEGRLDDPDGDASGGERLWWEGELKEMTM